MYTKGEKILLVYTVLKCEADTDFSGSQAYRI